MSLRCSFKPCADYELARGSQLAFYQDLNNGGWNLGLGPEFIVSQSPLPSELNLITSGDERFPYNVVCKRCDRKVGKANAICGFDQLSINFSAAKVILLQTRYSTTSAPSSSKWSKVVGMFPQIRKITAEIPQAAPIIGSNTVHFHGVSDFQQMVKAANSVASRSNLNPRRYQWRAYFFACLQNVLLCLPTGMGKTLIANMLMKAYYQLNPSKVQVFIVPTVVLVEQQATTIEHNTGLKVQRRSGEHSNISVWSPDEICVCTPAMLNQAIKKKQVDMSQISLLVFDEVHEANSANSEYGRLLPLIAKCYAPHRPKVLALTASPSGANTKNIRECILELCGNLDALPFSPLVDDQKNTEEGNGQVTCEYIEIVKTSFELTFEAFVFETLENLSRLHQFFASHWKDVPINVIAQLKVNSIEKILSHAEGTARHSNEVVLYQLAMFMKKWVQTLDLLRIFGPRKLVQFIRADLEHTDKNDSLKTIRMQISPLLTTCRYKLSQMEACFGIAVDSSRTATLLNKLKQHQSEEARILVFVERRDTAERLSRRLQDDPDIGKMNPEYVVGNSSNGTPKERQQEIMERFRSGECQVLVATSVLEQGIDVAACNVVICFDGVKSTKSIIQSRGRARKKSANFIVFVTTEGRSRINELTQMEQSMNYAIQRLMNEKNSKFLPDFAQEIEKFLESDRDGLLEHEEIDDEWNEEDLEFDEIDEINVITLRFFNFNDQYALADHISGFFTSPHDSLKLSRKFIVARFTVKEEALERSKIIRNISSLGDPRDAAYLSTWIEIPMFETETTVDIKPPAVSFTFHSLTGFFFKNCVTVCIESNFIWKGFVELQIVKNVINLKQSNESFTITAFDINGPILINETNSSFEVFLCLANPPNFYRDKDRAAFDFNDRSFNFRLRSDVQFNSKMSGILRKALESFSVQVYNVCNLKQQIVNIQSSQNEIISFQKSFLVKAWHSKYAAVLPPKLPDNIIAQFKSVSSIANLQLLLENTSPERFQKLTVQSPKDMKLPFNDLDTPSNYVSFGRVKVTPSRFIFMPMVATPKSRVFRYFPNPENFLLVSLIDEHEGNPWQSKAIYDWFLKVLIDGICVGGKVFTFLGCSNSQLREGHCWFSCLDRRMVYDKIGRFPDAMNAGRKLTRLALAFASSIETVALNHDKYLRTVAPDVENELGVCFSDGIGRGSRDLFTRVTLMMHLQVQPSAFQIRVGGVKGVISVYDKQQDDVMFRESMKKFESDHNMLEVLSFSRSIKFFLNRHVILLLSSFGVPDKVFMDLQFKELEKCMEALTDDESALNFVKSRSTFIRWEMYPPDRVVQEPLFRGMLYSNAIELISNIVDYAHIFIDEGRVLMGVLDETNTLEYGEVYAHIVENNFEKELEGKVVVFRNPAVLPSDIRLLTARSRNLPQSFKNLYRNCLVVPARGPSCHAHECSGGDLDGDLFYIIWDKRMIPPNLPSPGVKVIEVETTVTSPVTGNSDRDMIEFFCDYTSNFQLGVIANAHLATADKLGMNHPKSIELARYVTAETDAPKKGLSVGRIKADLLPKEYPDYMRKGDKPTYRSETVLGALYRQAYPLLEVLLESRTKLSQKRRINLGGDEGTIESFYSLYTFELKRLMQSFELHWEVDLFSGTPTWPSGYVSNYKQQNQLRETVADHAQDFWLKWQLIFEKWRVKFGNDQQKILEWYNRPKSCKWPIHSFSFLAMPFVDFEESTRRTITDFIQVSTMRWIYHNKMPLLTEWIRRQNVGLAVMDKLKGVECHFYGSSMLGLSEEYSDIDLYASNGNFESLSRILMDLDKNAVALKKPHACVSLTFDSCAVDVTNFIGGVRKTYALAEAFDEYPGFWPALRVLIEWARNARIVKSGGGSGIMNVVSFCHLFIYFASSATPRTTMDQKPYTIARLSTWIESLKDSPCGKFIFDFLKMLSSRHNKVWIASRVDPLNGEVLIKSDLIEELSRHAEVAIYILAIYEGDVQKLFQFCTKKRLFRIQKLYMNPSTIKEEEKIQNMKEIEAKCNPGKCHHLQFVLLERNGVFYLEITGDHKHFQDVERVINKIHSRILSARFSGLRKEKSYHIANSTIIIPEYGYGGSTEVSFSMYEGTEFQTQHYGLGKSVLEFRNSLQNFNWRPTEYERYKLRFISQIELFRSKKHLAVKGTRHWRFFGEMFCNIRCGNNYFFHVPETLHNTFETTCLKQVETYISKLEESLNLESETKIIQDLKSGSKLSLIQDSKVFIDENAPLALMPLKEAKNRSQQKKREIQAAVSKTVKKATCMRHSFYPSWTHDHGKTREFAIRNGFRQVPLVSSDFYCNVSFYWRQRELKMSCDRNGMIEEIKHRNCRWLSTTIKRYDKTDGYDVRAYLETRAPLDEDESVLETIVRYLDGRSIFTETFAQQIAREKVGVDEEFSTKPLIPEMLHFNWRFRGIRRITPIYKFVNSENDILILHEIHDGIFNESRTFEWFNKHYEVEIRMNMKRSDLELCKRSFEMSLMLFDFTKLK